MKLLLTSGGLENESIISALKDLAQKPLNKLNLAFIPTASNVEEVYKSQPFFENCFSDLF